MRWSKPSSFWPSTSSPARRGGQIEQLLLVLDRQDLAAAQARLKAGFGLRQVK